MSSRMKLAAILAFVIGAMAIFAGGQVVLLGKEQNYYVISWLPYYNFTVGLITFFVTAVLLWKNSPYARAAALATFAAHATVMLILQTAYRDVVAAESIKAMTVRLSVWTVILLIIYWPQKRASGG